EVPGAGSLFQPDPSPDVSRSWSQRSWPVLPHHDRQGARKPAGPLHSNDLGQFCDLDPPGGEAAMTVATPRSGFDLEYYLNRTGGGKTGGGYYLNAAPQREADRGRVGKGAGGAGVRGGEGGGEEACFAGCGMGRWCGGSRTWRSTA